jgi:DNA-binding MarR family transcriptional regulator
MNAIRSKEIADRTARLLPLAVDRLQRLQHGLADSLGLSRVQVQLLEYVHRNGPSSISTLTRALRRAQSSISELTDRLAQKGYVRRQATGDRRKSLVALTQDGRHFMLNRDGEQRQALANEFAVLPLEHREIFLHHLTELLRLTDRLRRADGQPLPTTTEANVARPQSMLLN